LKTSAHEIIGMAYGEMKEDERKGTNISGGVFTKNIWPRLVEPFARSVACIANAQMHNV
jgi:hypothetical protein